jgi:hypothetical protein
VEPVEPPAEPPAEPTAEPPAEPPGPTPPAVVEREPPRFTPTLGAVGGVFVVGGALGLIGQIADGDAGRILTGLFALAVGAAALIARTQVTDRPPVATALTAVAAIAAGAGVLLLLVDPSSVDGPSSLTAPLLFAAIVWLVLFFAGPAKNRPILLGLALVAIWFAGLTLVDPTSNFRGGTRPTETPTFSDDGTFTEAPPTITFNPFEGFDVGGALGDIGAVSLLFGAGYLIASAAFDRGHRHDVSPPFVGAGIPATAIGLVGISADLGSTPGALITLGIAGLVCWLGANNGRRLTTWVGAAGVAIALGVLGDKIDGTDNETASSVVAIVLGVALVALSTTVLRRAETP